MRKTAKEKYTDALSQALRDLGEIEGRLERSRNPSEVIAALAEWQCHTSEVIGRFGTNEDRSFFRGQHEFTDGMTSEAMRQALHAYSELLKGVLHVLPECDVKNGYDEDVLSSMTIIDDLLLQIGDLYRRASRGERLNPRTASDGLERWLDRAYKMLGPIVGDDEAAKLYSVRHEYAHIEEQFSNCMTHLQDLKEEMQKYPEHFVTEDAPLVREVPDPKGILAEIFNRFETAVTQLRHRHGERETLDVNDEYDVQDLLQVLLRTRFDDVRAEEVSPSYAGASSKIDFLLKESKMAIEVKVATAALRDAKIGEQLLVDIARYQSHPTCEVLICFIYDPKHHLRNPAGLVNDLGRRHGDLDVQVFIRP